ncbi:Type II/IV secretion system protein [uncultured Desulfobacterium sp.]|uniref:Type II/IV secretion system protein n=1 Tax=uncultured Desulfobacterium sp. TaxID=201089 RepID=A0A445MRI9_9BACT|nr:Type II/IV secretion system protein [uncultured Desulfobacterium sp.]
MTQGMENPMIDIDAKIKEADVYHSMGLIGEAIAIYEQILSSAPDIESDKQGEIKSRLEELEKKYVHIETERSKQLSSEDLSYIKETLAIDEDVTAVLDSAFAFKELGLFSEAASEYEKLLGLDYPVPEIVPDLVQCLIQTHTLQGVMEEVGRIIDQKELGDKEKAEARLLAGSELEKVGHNEEALKLYQSAKELDPMNEEVKDKINFLMSSLSTGSKYDYLLNQEMMDTDQLKKALEMSKKVKKSVEFILIEHFNVKKEEMGKSLSLFYGCPFKGYTEEIPTPIELIGNLKESFLLHELWVPLSWDQEGIFVLVDDPRNLGKTDNIKSLLKTKKLLFSVGIKEDIEAFIKRFFRNKDESYEDMVTSSGGDVNELIPDISFEEEMEREEDTGSYDEASGKVVKFVDHIIVAAYRKNASDIHIEPSPVTKNLNIRFRIDGLCQEYMTVPNSMARAVLSRIKIMAGLDIAERRLPQDGKIKFKRKGIPPFELRLATLPSPGGYEDAVMRILAKSGAMKLDEMGLIERNLRIMKEIIAKPYGLVLVVGPTGSGKTTSLHAALGYINTPERKIWTAEDPIEISQLGLRQIEVKPQIGLDFARVMRAFLRADPDVIMIGEMRDEETASIGIEASLTGHLVFSTLHTNSAPETVTRLLDMGLNALNFSDAFLGVMAQRLVRSLCPKCKVEYHPTEDEFQDIVTHYGKDYFDKTGITYSPELKLYRKKGCDACANVGYKGRLGIHELMEGTAQVKRMIKKADNTENLFRQAIEDGMTTLKQDGIIKVFNGLTDLDEVRRVCIN